jgi:hypothetical protein
MSVVKKRIVPRFALALFLSSSVVPVSQPANVYSFRKSFRTHGPVQIQGQRSDGTVGSLNWAGYAALGPDVTDARGSWTVPPADCSSDANNSFASFWTGIDGYSSNSVEQIGTDSDCSKGQPTYYAWFEFYPGPSFIVEDFPVTPGDNIEAEISYDDNSQVFTLHERDVTTGQSFRIRSAVPNAKRNSAEWIAEAPSNGAGNILPLSHFGSVFLGHYYTGVAHSNTATISGTTGTIGSFGKVSDIVMVKNDGTIKALPSPLSSNGSSFAVTRE